MTAERWSPPTGGYVALEEVHDVGEVLPLPRRSTWAVRIPLGPAIRVEGRLEPTFLVRTDGCAGFYPGRVNHVVGEPEAAKTTVSLIAAKESVSRGGRAFFLDWEDDKHGTDARLQAIGVSDEEIETSFYYLNPEGPPDLAAFADAYAPFTTDDVVILDAMTAAFAASAVDGNRDVEVLGWLNAFAKPLSRLGPCLIVLDHLGKDTTRGARGSSAKRDAVSGVQLTALKRALLAPGNRGVTSLEVTKDRIGAVRQASLGGTRFGDVILDATTIGTIVTSIEPPLPNAHAAATERVARAVASLDPSPDRPVTTRAIQDAVGAPHLKTRTVQEALSELHASGEIGRRMDGRTAWWWLT